MPLTLTFNASFLRHAVRGSRHAGFVEKYYHENQTLHFPIRIAEMFPMTPKTLKSQIITAIT
ncbi:MAG: hypothetical protein WB818_09540, partial [Desulfobacterales bacterium]